MKLRRLVEKDAPLMLEWMHDQSVVEKMYTDFSAKTLEDCITFICNANDVLVNKNFVYMAIVTDQDEYMGTVGLKSINFETRTAEFAIAIRKAAMGRGYGWYGMMEILDKAFNHLELECVYWCVSKTNERACRFYEKHEFHKVYDVPQEILSRYESIDDLLWFSVLKGDDYRNRALRRDTIAGCKILSIQTIPTLNAGELSFFEGEKGIPFEIKRFYYISKVPEGTRRGYHAHKSLKQILFCPYGEIQLVLDDGIVREEITLNDPSIGIIIDKPVWREMIWMKKNSVLCVAASEFYDEHDYIRDYKEFRKYVEG